MQGNSNTYVKNPNYWGTEKINGVETKLPLVDKVVYRTIKDEATFNSPRCAPASSTSSNTSDGRRSTS